MIQIKSQDQVVFLNGAGAPGMPGEGRALMATFEVVNSSSVNQEFRNGAGITWVSVLPGQATVISVPVDKANRVVCHTDGPTPSGTVNCLGAS